MLARQRSGTNALRSVLNSHPDVFCLTEVFSFMDRNSKHRLTRKTNFFNFLVNYAGGDVSRILPDQHEKIFLAYLAFLRSFSKKRFILIDVKFNTTHFLTPPYTEGAMKIRCAHCGKKRGLGATSRRFWESSVWSFVIFRFCGQRCLTAFLEARQAAIERRRAVAQLFRT
jgi:hypothetical protein